MSLPTYVPAPMPAQITKPTPDAIAAAGRLIAEGRLVAFPTETVYGLGADATSGEAVARVFAAKGRPSFNPLIVHVLDLAAAEMLGQFSPLARRLAETFWPGPLTLVVARRPGCPVADLASAGLDTLALRSPDHPVARALLAASGRPIAAPSANRSGHVSATRAQHVAEDLGESVAMILDGGPTAHGLESTVLDAHGDDIVLLRPGAIPAETIEAALGIVLVRPRSSGILNGKGDQARLSPGQLESHYAPRATVRLNAIDVQPGEALVAFGAPLATTGPCINLSPGRDTIEAAAGLFAALRALDATGVSGIAVMPIPEEGLGEAINDRLRRAAQGR